MDNIYTIQIHQNSYQNKRLERNIYQQEQPSTFGHWL